MKTFGLIGKKLSHSFSQHYFQEKFFKENIKDCQYLNFELEELENLSELITKKNITGLNITIPFKESIVPFLDKITNEAKKIGAVNTIEIKGEKIIGHNTDVLGFEKSFLQVVGERNNAIILGNGGASKTIQYVLQRNNINYLVASRNSDFTIKQIDKNILQQYDIIINSTPLGMHPDVSSFPYLPYEFINTKHLLFDLVYNPEQTIFLANGKANGAQIKNGKQMLHLQAEESWKIWN
ncbi:MAG: shikimate dehydrogenase [Bacteroidota bacterium]|nr:shikimate dehydrogenase [Bacteroidota bacterium]